MKRKHWKIGCIWFLTACVFMGMGYMCGWAASEIRGGSPKPIAPQEPSLVSGVQSQKTEPVLLNVPYISQEGLLPTGCEIISALMVLRFYGYTIPLERFVDNYLDKAPLTFFNGQLTGPHPDEAFVGSPYDENGYGCYAPVIVSSLRRIVSDVQTETNRTDGERRIINTTGLDLDSLLEKYIDQGIPVLVWATIRLNPSTPGTVWIDRHTGESFTWKRQEHCMVLVGYDSASYYFNDPYQSNGVCAYDRETVRRRFAEMGSQSVVMLPG